MLFTVYGGVVLAKKNVFYASIFLEQSKPDPIEVGVSNLKSSNNISCLADWFEVTEREQMLGEIPQGTPALWSEDVRISRISEHHLSGDRAFRQVLSDGKTGVERTLDEIPADFSCSAVTIDTEFLNCEISRNRFSEESDESTKIKTQQSEWVIPGHLRRAWYVDDSKALAVLTNRQEYLVITETALLSFGITKGAPPAFFDAKPCYIPGVEVLFLLLNNREIRRLTREGDDTSIYIPVFPPRHWEAIDELSRTMMPADLKVDDVDFQFPRLPTVALTKKLSVLLRANKAEGPFARVLRELTKSGDKTVADIYNSSPHEVFSGAHPRLLSKKLVVEVVAKEIAQACRGDYLRLEQTLMLSNMYQRGWPRVNDSSPNGLEGQIPHSSAENDLSQFLSKKKNLTLGVHDIRLSINDVSRLDLFLSNGLVVETDLSLNPKVVKVPFWGQSTRSIRELGMDLNSQKLGDQSLGLLAEYASIFIETPVLGQSNERAENTQSLNRQPGNIYSPSGQFDYVEMLKSETLDVDSLPQIVSRNLRILRLRANGQTLQGIAERFALTREAVRRVIAYRGGAGFVQYMHEINREDEFEYVALLKSDPGALDSLPDAVKRNLDILSLRASGETIPEIAKKFALTRETTRQIISRCGGVDFVNYVNELRVIQDELAVARCQTIQDFVIKHPGITREELVEKFEQPLNSLLSCLTKLEMKFLAGRQATRKKNLVWTDEDILEALRLAQTYHYPLTSSAYQKLVSVGEIDGPSVPLIGARFKTWKLACISAGVEFVESGTTYSLTWSRNDLVAVIEQYLQDASTTGTVADYESWREKSSDNIPSSAQLRIVVGPWSEARDEALGNIRVNSWDMARDF